MKEKDLKTLKDLPDAQDTYYSRAINEQRLRAEAVKWVKAKPPKLYGVPIIEGKYSAENVRTAIKNWIKHFFNLTEEDLK